MTDQLDSWDAFTGNYLKAEDVKSEGDAYVVIGVDTEKFDGKTGLKLQLERNEVKKDFSVNKTNAKKVRDLGITSPKVLVGKRIYFKKVTVTNPTTKQEVESLRILKVE